jgi:hypothetical protein
MTHLPCRLFGETHLTRAELPAASPAPTYQLCEGVLIQKLGAELVLMHIAKGEYFELNRTGTIIFEALIDHSDMAQVAATLSTRFEVGVSDAHNDVCALTRSLVTRGLLQLR